MSKTLRISSILIGVAGLAFAIALEAQDAPQVGRLSIGKSAAEGVTDSVAGRTWHLGALNRTSEIGSANLYRNHVVVSGWLASGAGLTTVIDAETGQETLEFLALQPKITPDGRILFTRHYAHFTDPDVIDEVVAELDLNGPIPHRVPTREWEPPADDVGASIYPSESTPGVRHFVFGNYVVADVGGPLFIADLRSTGDLCIVRLSPKFSGHRTEKSNCKPSAVFGVSSLFGMFDAKSDGAVGRLAADNSGDLAISILIYEPKAAHARTFLIDEDSLEFTENRPETPEPAASGLRVPWGVQRAILIGFVAPDLTAKELAGHLLDRVEATLTIDTAGNVRQATVSGLPSISSGPLKSAILKWKFKPTILDGKLVEVTTAFSSPVNGLTKIP